MAELTLVKYEGLGNDFLVLVDVERAHPYDAQLTRALCDRHYGVGADGLLRLSSPRGGGDFLMELRNADGSIAETSGNGMRCAVLGARDSHLISSDEVMVETIVGVSRANILSSTDVGGEVRVEMGRATIESLPAFDLSTRRAYGVNVGNPHLVLVGDRRDDLVITTVGPALEEAVAGGQNVELATPADLPDTIVVETWERGAGFTLACGSGSSAAAAAMRLTGQVGDRVVVENPGGAVTVDLSGERAAPEVVLTGGARRIATIVINAVDLVSLMRAMRARE